MLRRLLWTLVMCGTFCFFAWMSDPSPALLGQETPRASDAASVKEIQLAREAMAKGVRFFVDRVAVNGGYVYQVSSDLRYREGEGDAGEQTVFVQPPGTPAVGLALIEAFERTREPSLLEAAKQTAECMLRGQLLSGGWQQKIEFDPSLRAKIAYRVDPPKKSNAKNWSSLDDNQTQTAIRFLARVDRVLEFQDAKIHEGVEYALRGLLANQFPNGAWAQGFQELDPNRSFPILDATYPQEWPRKHPGGDYWIFYTLNDNAMVRTMDTLWFAYDVYQEERYKTAALKGAEFLLRGQMPDPQPAWAQQYDYSMHPVWARKFEPPAISGGESQEILETLMDTFDRTGDSKYLAAVQRGLEYLVRCKLSDGKLARFYELETNRPLFFTKSYELTYDDSDMPTHYSFKVQSKLDSLQKRLKQLQGLDGEKRFQHLDREAKKNRQLSVLNKPVPKIEEVHRVIRTMNEAGAWVESGKLKYVKAKDYEDRIISSETFIQNLETLSRFVAGGAR